MSEQQTLLDRLRQLVEDQPKVECPCLKMSLGVCQACWKGEDDAWDVIHDADCERCHGTGEVDNPAWADMLEVVREKCPCTLVDPSVSYLPYEDFPTTCKRCYIRGRHTPDCVCHGTGFVPYNWEGQRDGAYRGALLVAAATAHLTLVRTHMMASSRPLLLDMIYSMTDEEATGVVIAAMGKNV